jgi:hypothetical protein
MENFNEPIFKTNNLGMTTTVFKNRIETKTFFIKKIILLNQVASISPSTAGRLDVEVETTGGKKFNLPVGFGQKDALVNAIYQAQAGL